MGRWRANSALLVAGVSLSAWSAALGDGQADKAFECAAWRVRQEAKLHNPRTVAARSAMLCWIDEHPDPANSERWRAHEMKMLAQMGAQPLACATPAVVALLSCNSPQCLQTNAEAREGWRLALDDEMQAHAYCAQMPDATAAREQCMSMIDEATRQTTLLKTASTRAGAEEQAEIEVTLGQIDDDRRDRGKLAALCNGDCDAANQTDVDKFEEHLQMLQAMNNVDGVQRAAWLSLAATGRKLLPRLRQADQYCQRRVQQRRAAEARARATEATQIAADKAELGQLHQDLENDRDPAFIQAGFSGAICEAMASRKTALADIAEEKKYARIGGVVDLHKLYSLQDDIARADRRIRSWCAFRPNVNIRNGAS